MEGDCPFDKKILRCYDQLNSIHTPVTCSNVLQEFIENCHYCFITPTCPLLLKGQTLKSTIHHLFVIYIRKNKLNTHDGFKPDPLLLRLFGDTLNQIQLKYQSFDVHDIKYCFIQSIIFLNTQKMTNVIVDKEQLVTEAHIINNILDTTK
jgi:hypothetical protein